MADTLLGLRQVFQDHFAFHRVPSLSYEFRLTLTRPGPWKCPLTVAKPPTSHLDIAGPFIPAAKGSPNVNSLPNLWTARVVSPRRGSASAGLNSYIDEGEPDGRPKSPHGPERCRAAVRGAALSGQPAQRGR